MTPNRLLLVIALAAGLAHAQANRRRPYVGYLCAAGGQRGTIVRITAGGQNLRGAKRVFISGEGVHATVIGHRRAAWLLKPDERRAVAKRLRQLTTGRKGRTTTTDEAPLPDHPMLRDLESLSRKELRRVAHEFLDPARRSQLSAQIAETVEIKVQIDARAELGDRELRIETPRGLTNPMLFFVGSFLESSEREPNDYRTTALPVVELPHVLNGQVTFKDVDRFRFRAKRGQRLVIQVHARRLVPYLADAVPGWFQATLALFDAEGRRLAFSDDYRFDPDPLLLFDVPADGEYLLQIRDAIYRGREDFVYRVTIAERPFVTGVFPLGGRAGSTTIAELDGWNLPWTSVRLNTARGADDIRVATRAQADLYTNPFWYEVGDLRECREREPNDAPGRAQKITPPTIVNGRIAAAGDIDVFRFEGRRGQQIVAEVLARRLGSPLDSVLHLVDDTGRVVVAFNDDHDDKRAGLVTHQADSYLSATLPGNGTYLLRVADAQGHGGAASAYRLRVSAPRPDFDVIVAPASVNVPATGIAAVTVHAVRRDGFEGAIDLSLDGAPAGFALGGARIPTDCERIRVTLTAPARRFEQPVPLRIVARARIGGRVRRRPAVPAEEMMQAFGLRHLVPARQLLVHVARAWRRRAAPALADNRPVRIPVDGTAEVRIEAPGLAALAGVRFTLSEPPPGVTLRDVRAERNGLVLVLGSEIGRVRIGEAGNLIVEAEVEVARTAKKRKEEKKRNEKNRKKGNRGRRKLTGLLPAVPFIIVAPRG